MSKGISVMARLDWQFSEPPKDHEVIIFGYIAGEINGIEKEPCQVFAQYLNNGRSDYPGFEYAVTPTDAYIMWVKPIAWREKHENPVMEK